MDIKMQKRFLIITPYGTNRSGIEIAVTRLVKKLLALEFKVTIWSLGSNRIVNDIVIKGFRNVDELEKQILAEQSLFDVLYWAGLFFNDSEVLSQIAISFYLIKSLRKEVYFLLERTGYMLDQIDEKLLQAIVVTSSTKVATVNKQEARNLYDRLKLPHEIAVIPTGVDTKAEFYPVKTAQEKIDLRISLALPIDYRIGVNTSRFVYRKGLDFLLEVWGKTCGLESKLFLIIIGSGFDDPKSIEKQIRNTASLHSNVRIVTYTPDIDLRNLYQVSDFAVFPSRQEGEPTALIECMACGLPILASNIPGHNELVVSNQTGLLFNMDNFMSLQSALNAITLMSNDELGIMGFRAREETSAKRDLDVIVRKFLVFVGCYTEQKS